MVMAMRVVGNKEGDGDGNVEVMGNGDGDKDGGHATRMRVMATATATTWAMATTVRVAGNIEGNSKCSKGDGDGNEGGSRVKGQWQGQKELWQWQQRG